MDTPQWRFHRMTTAHGTTDDLGQWSDGPAAAAHAAGAHRLPHTLGGFEVDSVALFRSPSGDTTEVVYTSPNRSRELRLITGVCGADHGVVGEADSHPAPLRFTHTGHGTDIAVAAIDAGVGPFDAVWSHGGRDWKVLSSSGVDLDRGWFTSALDTLVKY